jgi:hypothetical protein
VVYVVNINVADDTALIDDEDGALRISFLFTEDIIAARHLTMWPKIAQQRIIDAPQIFSPRGEGGCRVNADAQDLGVQSREAAVVSLIRRDLCASYPGPGEREEGNDDVLAAVVAQRDRLFQMAGQCKIRCQMTDLKFHELTSKDRLF